MLAGCRTRLPARNGIGVQAILRTLVILLIWLAGSLPVSGATITVFAAASLTDALKEIASGYELAGGDKIIFNFGSSGLLVRQILEGAPGDVFFSADEAQLDKLDQLGLIVRSSRRSLLSNSLVIVVPKDSPLTVQAPADLADPQFKHLALADPKSVPAGIYARQYFERRKLWSAIASKVVPTENVRGALAAVASGNVEAGLVYKTDAAISRQVKIAFEIAPGDAPPISYPVAVLKDSRQSAAATRFVEYLASAPARAVFKKFGFLLPPEKAP